MNSLNICLCVADNTFMKLLFFSFILLLTASSNVFGLTEQEKVMLNNHGQIGPKILLHTDRWGVNPSKIDVDGVFLKAKGKV